MNILQPWNLVFFLGFIAYLGIRSVYARRTKFEPKSAPGRSMGWKNFC